MSMKTKDYSHLSGKKIQYGDQTAVVVAVLYERGITVVAEDDPEDFCICLNKESRRYQKDYDIRFAVYLKAIEHGAVGWQILDKLIYGRERPGFAVNHDCAFR